MSRRKAATAQDDRLMTLEQAAVAAGVSVRTIARYRKLGALDVVRDGRRVLCTIDAIERAIVRRSPQQVGREALAEERDTDPLATWLDLLLELATATAGFESPAVLRQYTEEINRRFPAAKVRDLTIADLREVHSAIVRRATGSELIAAIVATNENLTVRQSLTRLRARFIW